RLVLVSPIAFENLSHERDLPNGVMENENLALYTDALRGVAQKHQLTFIDLFAPTLELYKERQNNFTINGFAPTDHGYRALAKLLGGGICTSLDRTSQADPELLRKMVLDKDWFWFNDFQVPNGVHVYGRRYAPHGDANYPDELEKTRDMTLLRE